MSAFDLSFKIESIDALHLSFPDNPGYWEQYRQNADQSDAHPRYEFKPGWQTVYATMVETPLVKTTLTDSNEGWGESNTPIAPEIVCLMLEAAISRMVIGREFESPFDLWDFVYDSQRGRGITSGYWMDALAALDIALWDALGKRHDMPVAAILDVSYRTEIPVYLSGLRQEMIDQRIEHAGATAAKGIRGIKIFQNGDIDAALREIDALMRAAPDVEQWMVDTLWMCDLRSAKLAKLEFGDRSVRFFECPLQPEDLAGHRSLAVEPGAPIALGEHFRTRYQLIDWLQTPPSFDIYQPDIGRTGISDFMRQRDLTRDAGLPVTPHMGNGAAVFQAATLQCAALSSPEFLQEFQGGLSSLLQDAAQTQWEIHEGVFRLPDAPGVGVTIDEKALDRYIAPRTHYST